MVRFTFPHFNEWNFCEQGTEQSSQVGMSNKTEGQYAPAVVGGAFRQRGPMNLQPLPLMGDNMNLDEQEMMRIRTERARCAGGWIPEFRKRKAFQEAFGSIWI